MVKSGILRETNLKRCFSNQESILVPDNDESSPEKVITMSDSALSAPSKATDSFFHPS